MTKDEIIALAKEVGILEVKELWDSVQGEARHTFIHTFPIDQSAALLRFAAIIWECARNNPGECK